MRWPCAIKQENQDESKRNRLANSCTLVHIACAVTGLSAQAKPTELESISNPI